MKTLDHLRKGEKAIIKELKGENLAVKLLEMGLLPGKEIQLIRSAPLGCPLYLKVSGQFLSLRREEAANLIVH